MKLVLSTIGQPTLLISDAEGNELGNIVLGPRTQLNIPGKYNGTPLKSFRNGQEITIVEEGAGDHVFDKEMIEEILEELKKTTPVEKDLKDLVNKPEAIEETMKASPGSRPMTAEELDETFTKTQLIVKFDVPQEIKRQKKSDIIKWVIENKL